MGKDAPEIGVLRGVLVNGDVREGEQQEEHLREHSPEHPDFGERHRERSREHFQA